MHPSKAKLNHSRWIRTLLSVARGGPIIRPDRFDSLTPDLATRNLNNSKCCMSRRLEGGLTGCLAASGEPPAKGITLGGVVTSPAYLSRILIDRADRDRAV